MTETESLEKQCRDLRQFYYEVKLFFEHTPVQRWTRLQVLRKLQELEIEWEKDQSVVRWQRARER